jgi:hypothetical protein
MSEFDAASRMYSLGLGKGFAESLFVAIEGFAISFTDTDKCAVVVVPGTKKEPV